MGGFHYVIPSTSGGLLSEDGLLPRAAASEESWNVTFGLMWVRGCNLPVLPGADNGWLGKRIIGPRLLRPPRVLL